MLSLERQPGGGGEDNNSFPGEPDREVPPFNCLRVPHGDTQNLFLLPVSLRAGACLSLLGQLEGMAVP